jgi:C-terminal processing protease CtpA/Prc
MLNEAARVHHISRRRRSHMDSVARARQPGRLPIVGILGLGSGACSKLVAPLMQRLHLN